MYCPKCGVQNPEGASYCQSCGSPLNLTSQTSGGTPINTAQPVPPPLQKTVGEPRMSGLAIASLVVGILGLSLLALIFGWIALNQMGKDPNLSGKGLAIAGLVLGIVGLAAGIIMAFVFIGLATFR
jgi:hypothetical protein